MRPIIQSAFDIKSKSAAAWGLQARRLKRAASVLFAIYSEASRRVEREEVMALEVSDDLEMMMPASLLYGLALENMLKAIIAQQKKPTAADIESLFGRGSGHSLADLAHRAGFDLSSDERDLVNRLSAFVEWAGRYPVAKKVEKMVVRQKAVQGEWTPLPMQQHESVIFEALFARADNIVFQ